jgi:hypothetical protein
LAGMAAVNGKVHSSCDRCPFQPAQSLAAAASKLAGRGAWAKLHSP